MRIAVIGAGSWGTALAQVAATAGNDVALWARRTEVAQAINSTRKNPDYLSHHVLADSIQATSDLNEAVDGAELVLVVTPSKAMRTAAESLAASSLQANVPVIVCTKGVEDDTGLVPLQVLEEVLGPDAMLGCLSGPNHAEEIIEGTPSATVVAAASGEVAAFVQEAMGTPGFRIYTSTDVIGVELCAAAKNVVAIAVGLSYGIGYGDNTAAALMTRGQVEMGRLVASCGGDPLTCMGLAGTGDLIATCMSTHSRNRTFGEALAKGEALAAYETRRHMVVEGAQACRSVLQLAQKHGVELPLAEAVKAIVWDGAEAFEVARNLLRRPYKPEFY